MKSIYLLPLIILHLGILSILQFTAWPEMTSFPYLLNNGFVTYKDMVHAYPLLLINILAILFKLFGYQVLVLKIFTWSLFVLNDILIFIYVRKFIKKNIISLLAVFSYIILQTLLEGNMIWPDLVIVPFLILGTIFLTNKNYWFAGLSFAFGLLIKQTGIFYLAFAMLYLLIFEKERKRIFFFGSGFVLPIFVFIIELLRQSSINDFLNWAVLYPSKYWTRFPEYVQLSPSLRDGLILLIMFMPTVFLIVKSKPKIFIENKFIILAGFLIAGFVGVYPRFSFFHLQSFLIFYILVSFYLISNLTNKYLYIFLLSLPIVFLLSFRNLQFGGNRFWDEGLNLGQKIELETSGSEPVYLLGLNSDLYAFSQRLPNKPWVDNFGWYLEIPGVQQSVLNSFIKNPPQKVFWRTPDNGNWYDIGSYQPKMITDYIQENYKRTSEIEKGIWTWERK